MKQEIKEDRVKKEKILIVDDSLESINILMKHLGHDYKVVPATNGKTALKLCHKSNAPDLILLDVVMPEMDGYEVCKALKRDPATEDIPVLFLTACDEVQNEIRGLELGAVDYITKPFSVAKLKARVKTHLELKKAREKLKIQNKELIKAAQLKEDVERMMHHDLKTPLNALVSVPAILIEDSTLSPSDVDLLKMMEQAAFDVLNMVNMSLNLYKMEQKIYDYVPVDLELGGIISKILNELTVLIEGKKISVKIEIDGVLSVKPKFSLKGERLLFYSMLSNLIKNAVEASPMEQEINIYLSKTPTPTFKIRNKGEVPSEMKGQFFKKYSTAGKVNGTGLGTYSAFLICKTISGNIKLDISESGYTSVSIEFPYTDKQIS